MGGYGGGGGGDLGGEGMAGFRLGVGVSHLVGSASAWSVKEGYPYYFAGCEGEKKKMSVSLLRNWREKKDCSHLPYYF